MSVCATFIVIDDHCVRHIVSKDTAPLGRGGQIEVEILTRLANRVIIDSDCVTQLSVGRGGVGEDIGEQGVVIVLWT